MMKKSLFIIAAAFLSAVAMAQKPAIQFAEKVHDFGTVAEETGAISHVFEFSNIGDAPLSLKSVQASCGCTTPQWSRESIAPGAKGSITVTYNTKGRPGGFSKTVTVSSNAERQVLTIKGNVTPKAQSVEKAYPTKVNDSIRLKSDRIKFGNINAGEKSMQKVAIANTSTEMLPITFAKLPSYISIDTLSLKEKERGNITIYFDASKTKSWGNVKEDIFYTIGNGKKLAKHKLSIEATIIEKFTEEQRKNAAVAEFENKVNAGKIAQGSKKKVTVSVKNTGKTPLLVRSVENNFSELTVKAPKKIAPGKSAEVSIEINTADLKPSSYSKFITLQLNDPNATRQSITVNYSVEAQTTNK